MIRVLRFLGKVILVLSLTLFCFVSLVATLYTIGYVLWFNDSVTLPNGMILRRQFEFWMNERDDMFASDGETLLARDIELVCFNDRYVEVWAYKRKYNGLYDAKTERRVPYEISDRVYAASGLSGGHGCNGYYTGMVGPGLLYDGMTFPFLPDCDWRNLDNPTLEDRSWFDRPCKCTGWPECVGTRPRTR